MTWQIVVLILGILAFVAFESYLNVLKERTEVARETLHFGAPYGSVDDRTETRLGNGDS